MARRTSLWLVIAAATTCWASAPVPTAPPLPAWSVCKASEPCFAQRTWSRPRLVLGAFNASCADIRSAQRIYDLSCLKEENGGLDNTWHLFMECLVHQSRLIELAERSQRACLGNQSCDVTVLIPTPAWKFVSKLFDFNREFTHIGHGAAFCFNVRTDVTVFSEDVELGGNGNENWNPARHASHNVSLQTLRDRVSSRYGPSATDAAAARPLAVLVNRVGRARSICLFYEMFMPAVKASLPGHDILVYNGTENVEATFALFTRASVVVCYHGAGITNAAVSLPGAHIIELALNHPLHPEQLYYFVARFICQMAPELNCITVGLDPEATFDPEEMATIRKLYNSSQKVSWGNPGFSRMHYSRACINVSGADVQRALAHVPGFARAGSSLSGL
jgi:hypothetical protein